MNEHVHCCTSVYDVRAAFASSRSRDWCGFGKLGISLLSELGRFRVEPAPVLSSLSCPASADPSDSGPSSLEFPNSMDFYSQALGICAGLVGLGQVLDLLFLVRHGWFRLVRAQARAAAQQTPLHCLLE